MSQTPESSTRNPEEAPQEATEKALQKAPDWSDALPGSSPLFWLACLIVLKLVAPFVPVPNLAVAIITSAIFTIAYVVAVVMFVATATRVPLSVVKWVILLIGAIAQWFFLNSFLPTRGGQ